MKTRWYQEFPLEGIILDVLLILLTYFSDGLRAWVVENARLAFWLVGMLQCGALFAIVLGGLWSDSKRPLDKWVDEKIGWLKGLLLILSAGGFMWLFVPAEAFDMYGAFTVNFFVTLFGSLGVMGFYWDNEEKFQGERVRIGGVVAVILYLVVSEALLVASVMAGAQMGGVILGLLLSYIPIRMLLLLRPPLNPFELFSATGAFVYFVVNLFGLIL